MRNSELLSKEWCELIFKGRNKAYGAYKIRRDTGRRYARAVGIVLGSISFVALVSVAMGLYVRHEIMKGIRDMQDVARMRPLEPEKGHEFKAIAAGKHIPTTNMRPGASPTVPEIVDGIPAPKPIGIDGPKVFEAGSDLFVKADNDTAHNANREDLQEEGIQLTPTEVVEQMPEFPGGIGALMKWLDQHIIYPQSCIRAKVQGDVEVTFIVDAQGNVREPSVSKKLYPDLDRAALMALQRMPKWNPGKVNGKAAIVRITVPVHFELN